MSIKQNQSKTKLVLAILAALLVTLLMMKLMLIASALMGPHSPHRSPARFLVLHALALL